MRMCRLDSVFILAIWGAAALFFWPILLGDRSLWARDILLHEYPSAWLTAHALIAGRLPLWEPLIGTGYPFAADPHSGVYYPLSAVLALLPFPRAYNVFVWVHVPMCGTFLYLLLRRWRLSTGSAMLAGCIIMFSGFTVSCVSMPQTLKGLPWCLLALITFDAFLAGGGVPWIAATALVLGVQGTSTDPQFSLFTAALLLVEPALRPTPRRVTLLCHALGLGVAGLLACLILAVQYIPLAELILRSDRASGLAAAEVAGYSVNPWSLINAVVPLPVPEVASAEYLLSFAGLQIPFVPDLYFGVIVIVLALASLGWIGGLPRPDDPGAPSDAREPSFGRTGLLGAGITLLATLVSFGTRTPFFGILITVVPCLQGFRYPSKYLWFVVLTVPMLAALGFEGLVRRRRGCEAALVGALVLCVVAASVLGTTFPGPAFLRAFWAPAQLDVMKAPAEALLSSLWQRNILGLLAPSSGVLLLWAAKPRWRFGSVLFLTAVSGFAVLDLAATTQQSYPVLGMDKVREVPRVAKLIWSFPGSHTDEVAPRFSTYPHGFIRYDGVHPASRFLWAAPTVLAQLRGAPHHLDATLVDVGVRLRSSVALETLANAGSPEVARRVLGAAGTRFLVHATPGAPLYGSVAAADPKPASDRVHQDGALAVEELDRASPRAFIAPLAECAPSGASLPTTSSLLAMPGKVEFEDPEAGAPPRRLEPIAIRSCEITRYGQAFLTVSFDLAGRGLLVVLDTDYPGWCAFVDGRPRRILPVCGLFRGVEVAGGEHVLTMVYEPRSFRAGAWISLAALMTAVLLFAVPRPFPRSSSP